jgi:hypothetical protein
MFLIAKMSQDFVYDVLVFNATVRRLDYYPDSTTAPATFHERNLLSCLKHIIRASLMVCHDCRRQRHGQWRLHETPV